MVTGARSEALTGCSTVLVSDPTADLSSSRSVVPAGMVTSAKRGDTAAERGAFAAAEAGAPAAPVVPPSARLLSGAFVPLQAARPTVNAMAYVHFFTFYPPSLRIFDLNRIAERHKLCRN